jgi:hypothetical protein
MHYRLALGFALIAFADCTRIVNTLVLTQQFDQKSLTASVGTQVQVKLPDDLDWSEVQSSEEGSANPVLRRMNIGSASKPSANAVFVADHPGTVNLSAHGRAKCPPGQACPHFVTAWHASIVVR